MVSVQVRFTLDFLSQKQDSPQSKLLQRDSIELQQMSSSPERHLHGYCSSGVRSPERTAPAEFSFRRDAHFPRETRLFSHLWSTVMRLLPENPATERKPGLKRTRSDAFLKMILKFKINRIRNT
jgi:hypothetical protein